VNEVKDVIDCLEKTPVVLNLLLSQIPDNLFRVRRVKGKWSIHEQVCHLTEAQGILIYRFRQFEEEENPLIQAYEPTEERPDTYYLDMDMTAELESFTKIRAEMTDMFRGFPAPYWEKQGRHDAFTPYNTKLLLTHALNVDYAHLFSIEQLGLTKPEFEDEILIVP
jgi:uncharacterized damage-inducible protein DinB